MCWDEGSGYNYLYVAGNRYGIVHKRVTTADFKAKVDQLFAYPHHRKRHELNSTIRPFGYLMQEEDIEERGEEGAKTKADKVREEFRALGHAELRK